MVPLLILFTGRLIALIIIIYLIAHHDPVNGVESVQKLRVFDFRKTQWRRGRSSYEADTEAEAEAESNRA